MARIFGLEVEFIDLSHLVSPVDPRGPFPFQPASICTIPLTLCEAQSFL